MIRERSDPLFPLAPDEHCCPHCGYVDDVTEFDDGGLNATDCMDEPFVLACNECGKIFEAMRQEATA